MGEMEAGVMGDSGTEDIADTGDMGLGKFSFQRLPLPLVVLDDGEQEGELLINGGGDLDQPLPLGHDPLLLRDDPRVH